MIFPMRTIQRTSSETILRASDQFPVVLLTGARQVGKTTLLKSISEQKRIYVSLDDPRIRDIARNDPELFLQTYPPPVLIDEFQYAPALLPFIKMAVDAHPDLCGQFWLTGSQRFLMMRDVGESLAGRVAVFEIGGITQGEEFRDGSSGALLDGSLPCATAEYGDVHSLFNRIHRGMFPALASGRVRDRSLFYASYLQTYLERDVRDLSKVGDESAFLAFLKAAAARTAQLVNLSELARDVGISVPTAKAWLSILEASGVVYLLHPYSRNVTSRIVKTPKLHFLDTGLCCHLAGWNTVESAETGAMNGALLESYVVSEILRSHWNVGRTPELWFYRDKIGAEVDLLIGHDGVLDPMEIKKKASPTEDDVKAFGKLQSLGLPLGKGGILCLARSFRPLNRSVSIIPIGAL